MSADALCALLADPPPGFSWLDGGDGVVAAWPDDEIVGEDLGVLSRVRAGPDAIWIGWLSYEAGAAAVLGRPVKTSSLPGIGLRRFGSALRVRDGVVVGELGDARRLRQALDTATVAAPGGWPLQPLRAALDPTQYRDMVRAALQRIAAGDTYQVNVSQPLFAPWTGRADVGSLYRMLRARYPASMGGVVVTDAGTIVSNSPETLLRVEGDVARSWPIKGTRPRDCDATRDGDNAAALLSSVKDAAEHVMIVDLVRNDLGRLAVPGSVRAHARPELLSLPTVHHLVTEVRATLREDVTLPDLVASLFPGGSVTGAPKRSTIDIIDELEAHTRGIYCGSLIAVLPEATTLSIAIRTGLADDHGVSLCSGGGIVIDSDPEAERLETLDKARAFGG